MQIDNLENILARRKEIEGEIVGMLKETESDFTLDHVRGAIFYEEDNDDMMKVVAMFDPGSRTQSVHYGAGRGACPPKPRRRRGDASELSNVLELVTDAWNYFPHKILDGLSPAEKALEYRKNKAKKGNKRRPMRQPKIGGENDFYIAINKALKTTEHRDALLKIIKEFKGYKKFMSENLVSATALSNRIFMFRFVYQLKKNIWKDIEVYGDQSLAVLAEFLIEAMGWDNDHLDAFFFPEKRRDGIWKWYTAYEIGSDGVDNDQYPILHTDEVPVACINYHKNPKIGFVFDFGDDHRFMMEYRGIRDADKNEKRNNFPKVINQQGVPPEQYPDYEE